MIITNRNCPLLSSGIYFTTADNLIGF